MKTIYIARHVSYLLWISGGLVMSMLFSPIKIGPLTLANRIAVAPMCQYSAVNGQATDWHHMHLGTLASSGAGMLIIEATAVEPQGRISPADLGLWSETQQTALDRVLRAVRSFSSMRDGAVLGDGAPEDVINQENLAKLYDVAVRLASFGEEGRVCLPRLQRHV